MAEVTILYIIVMAVIGGAFCLRFIRCRNLGLLAWFWLGVAVFYGLPGALIGVGVIEPMYSPFRYDTPFLGLALLLISGMCVSMGFLMWVYSTRRMKRGVIRSFVPSWVLSAIVSTVIIIAVIVAVWHRLPGVSIVFYGRHQARELLGMLGPMAILLQIPQGIALYWWNRYFSNIRKTNILVPLAFTVVAGGVSLFRGQRTDLVLILFIPALLAYIWQKRRNIAVMSILLSSVVIVLYSAIFIVYDAGAGRFEVIARIMQGDIDRNWTLWLAMEHAGIDLSGSNVLPFPGAGYVNAALAYVPRSIAPWKGHSSTSWFTMFAASILGHDPGARTIAELNWGYSIGLPVEALINLGFLGLPLVSLIFGALLGVANNVAVKWKIWYPILAIIALFSSGLSLFTFLVVHLPIMFTAVGLDLLCRICGQENRSYCSERKGRALNSWE